MNSSQIGAVGCTQLQQVMIDHPIIHSAVIMVLLLIVGSIFGFQAGVMFNRYLDGLFSRLFKRWSK